MPTFEQYEAALTNDEKTLINYLKIEDPNIGIPREVTRRLCHLLMMNDMLVEYIEYMRKIYNNEYDPGPAISLEDWLKIRNEPI